MPKPEDKLEAAIQELARVGVVTTRAATTPVPLLVLTGTGDWSKSKYESTLFTLACHLPQAAGGKATWPSFRCVNADRLPVILRTGCDVEPSNAVMFVDHSASKALEYGDRANKVMLLFDGTQLRNSHREVPADFDPVELAELARDYPTRLVSEDGTHLWLSRLPEGNLRVNTPYEVEYARWIPGDPWKALQGVIVLGQIAETINRVRLDIADCRDVPWRLTELTPG